MRSWRIFGKLAPALFILTLAIFVSSYLLPGAVNAGDRRTSAGGRKGSGAQESPERRRETTARERSGESASRDRSAEREEGRSSSEGRRQQRDRNPSGERNQSRDRRQDGTQDRRRDRSKDRTGSRDRDRGNDSVYRGKERDRRSREDRSGDSRTTHRRRPPREIEKNPPIKRYKEKWPHGGKKKKEEHCGGDVVPVIPGRPPCIRPRPYRPPIQYHYTFINNYYYTYIYGPVCLPGLIDGELYGISLPFGSIVPWEIGEFCLIRLKNLEKEGFGGSMIIAIVQTLDVMGWEEFIDIYGDGISDVVYYGPIGPTSFLVAMTVTDILDLMVADGIRWVGEFYPEYKIVPGGRSTKFYVLSLEGDTIEFRRELRDAGVFVMGFDHVTQEYYVRSSEDSYSPVTSLWWVARVSGISGEPFFQQEDAGIDVGMSQ
jgi:hypothetical protein